jgi:glucose-6-phosphate isomerase
VHFLDNADPQTVDSLTSTLRGKLTRTLVSVVSKCGWTPTTRHIMCELRAAFARNGLGFSRHAVATTMHGTELDRCASDEHWLARFPLWDWLGGRTSVTSAVGLLPAALRGVDIRAFLDGASAMDRLTRHPDPRENPAALLALMWHWLGRGRGDKNMVVLPYRDRLSLLARYVQQLVMESLGKESDRQGAIVHQGLTVYGNKGSTDQHAYIQQLRDGRADFFVNFVCVQDDGNRDRIEVGPGSTLGDHLFASLEATRDALYERDRESVTITLRDLTPRSLGGLIALYERAVGLYAELVDVNAYHQPGVAKDAAARIVTLQGEVRTQLVRAQAPLTAEEVSEAIGSADRVETVFKLLDRMALATDSGVTSSHGAPQVRRFSMPSRVSDHTERVDG